MNLQELGAVVRDLSTKVEKLWKGSKHGKAEAKAKAATESQDGAEEGPVPEASE